MTSDGWRAQAACIGHTATMFATSPNGVARAKALCAACPVKVPCLVDALRTETADHDRCHGGVRGGLTPTELIAYRRRRTA